MKKFLLGCLYFGIVIIALALIIPLFINLNSYKSKIEQIAYKHIGRPLTIDGDITIALLPAPTVSVYNIKLSNPKEATQPCMLTMDKLKVSIKVLPLLSKKIHINRILLSKPQVVLETYGQDRNNWDLNVFHKDDKVNNVSKLQDHNDNSNTDYGFSVNSIEIINGSIQYITSTAQHKLHDITAALTAQSVKGPFRLDGFLKINNHDVKIIAKVKELTDNIPVKLTLTAQGFDTNIDGIYKLSQQYFDGDFHLSTDMKSLCNLVQDIQPKLYQSDISNGTIDISSHIVVSQSAAEMQRINIKLDKDIIEGQMGINLSPFNLNLNLQGGPGNISINTFLAAQKNQYKGTIKSKIDSLRTLVHWINPKYQNLPKDLMGIVSFDSDIIMDDNSLTLRNIAAKAKEIALTGHITNTFNNNAYTYKLHGQGLLPLLLWGGLPFKHDPGGVDFEGTTSVIDSAVISNHTVKIAGLNWNMLGKATMGSHVDGEFKIKANSTDSAAFLRLIMDDPSDVNRLDFTTNVKVSPQLIAVNAIDLTMGINAMTVTAQGDVIAKFDQARPFITADLVVGPFKIDDFFPDKDKAKRKTLVISEKDQQEKMPAEGPQSPINTLPAHEHWSRNKIDLTALKSFDGRFKLTLKEFSRTDLKFKNTLAEGTLQDGVISFPTIQSSFFDGQLKALFSLNAQNTPQLSLKFNIIDASLKRLIQTPGVIKIIGGKVNADTDIETSGHSLFDWISNLDGSVGFNIRNGAVSGFDLKGVSLKIKSLTSPTALVEMFTKLMNDGQTNFTRCVGSLAFHKGMGTFQELILDADGGKASGNGKINLPAYQLDVGGQIQLTDLPGLPPFKIRLYGPFDNPAKSIDTNGLMEYMMKNIFKTLTGANLLKSAGDIISNIFNGDAPQTDSQQNESSSSKKSKAKATQAPNSGQPNTDNVKSKDDNNKNIGATLTGALKGLF